MMWAFVWSPVRFFDARLHRPPNWLLALAAPVLCGLLDMSALLVLGDKNQAALARMLGPGGLSSEMLSAARMSTILTVTGYPIYFALTAMIMACLDVLAHDSGRQVRLVECAGLAFFAFIPACVFMLGVAVFWSPPPVAATVGASFMDVQTLTTRYLANLRADPWLSTATVVYYLCLTWCVALLAVVLKVAAAFSTRTAAIAAAALFAGFSGFWR